jgi:hypothetical protein
MQKPTPATVIALAALFVSLGGTTYAATNLPANSVGSKQLKTGAVTTRTLRGHAVTGSKVANNSLTGTQINVSTLGTVPNAAHATNADQLAGSPASSYRAHCPPGLKRVPNGNLCFDFTDRGFTTWTAALNSCALAGMRLPDVGELVQAFNDLGASQTFDWTSSYYSELVNTWAVALAQTASRELLIAGGSVMNGALEHYRCVTEASN